MTVLLAEERRAARTNGRLAIGVAAVAGIAAAALIWWLTGVVALAAGFLAAATTIAAVAFGVVLLIPPRRPLAAATDWNVARALAQTSADAVAVTDRTGRLVCANDRYEASFEGFPTPPALPLASDGAAELARVGRTAWRAGHAAAVVRAADGATISVAVTRAGEQQDMLLWRFAEAVEDGTAPDRFLLDLSGALGDRLGAAGVMAALVTPAGQVLSANAVLRTRATGSAEGVLAGEDLARYLTGDPAGILYFAAEGGDSYPVRLIQLPYADDPESPLVVALLDVDAPLSAVPSEDIGALVAMLPFGVALVDRDGRFMQMNAAFARATDADQGTPPLYPGDLVVREDKAALADAVRRFTGGAAQSMDLAVRLKDHPDEPIILSVASARGLGDAAVLLSLKDNGEERRLKREVAQATKMQAVGQLAGGVAHDFNNILTAIIGHCDLMLMRHSPGDSDYDDIQQVRANSNRAASLTRQLLAFSRQQTLRPQVLQLPDVVSEVSTLLRRLLGETVTLEVKHGRNLGAVRADPGQLEQVVVNLAVNARDAMLGKGAGGKLTIQTRSASIAEVRRRGTDIMPIGDYTALEITDTGTGIPPDVLPKIFEPFFTTKDTGKGTGLGLSTVYGIVKQSGGYIFADSRPGQGATFTIYLPVHAAGEDAAAAVPSGRKPRAGDLWGSGTILLVEDEDMVRAVAERALARQGYTIVSAENGEAALELIEGGTKPDLVISDVMMPLMDGPTLARALRRHDPNIPILFMSGYAEEQLRRSIDLDNVAFLPKPFSVQQIAEAARDVLAARAAAE